MLVEHSSFGRIAHLSAKSPFIRYITDSKSSDLICLARLRKDVLDQIDNGTKVQLAVQRVTNPEKAKKAEAAKKAAEEKEKKDSKRSGKKAGSWGGLP